MYILCINWLKWHIEITEYLINKYNLYKHTCTNKLFCRIYLLIGDIAWKKIKHFSYRPTQPKKLGSVKGKQSIFNLGLMQVHLRTCYQGTSTCITIYYIVSHDNIYTKELQLLQSLVHLYLSISFNIALLTYSFGKHFQSYKYKCNTNSFTY